MEVAAVLVAPFLTMLGVLRAWELFTALVLDA